MQFPTSFMTSKKAIMCHVQLCHTSSRAISHITQNMLMTSLSKTNRASYITKGGLIFVFNKFRFKCQLSPE